MSPVIDEEPDRRQPRLVLQLRTGVGQGGRAFDAEILNLSNSGLLVKTDASLSLDDPLKVVLPESGAVEAKVVWFAEGLYGCSFSRPIDDREIEAANQISSVPKAGGRGVDHETLGSRIKRLRVAHKLTMRGLAEQVGVSKPTLWKWEGDQVRPRHETMQRLASELGVSELELVYGAPGLDEAAALVDFDEAAQGSLADVVRSCRRRIAAAAGVDEASIDIVINWDTD